MSRRITLDEIKRLLQKGKTEGALLKDMDAMMGLIAFVAPLAVGLPPGTAHVIVEVLGDREALVKAGERLVERFAGIGGESEVDKYRAIEAAHLLISYSAFFDTVEKAIPGFWKELALDGSVQRYLSDRANAKPDTPRAAPAPPDIPDPLTNFDTHLAELKTFYNSLTQVIAGYLDVLKLANVNAAAKAIEYAALKTSLVEQSVERYQAQYVELAKHFPEFHIYANFHFQMDVDNRFRALSEAAALSRKQVDIGFHQLADAIAETGRRPAADTVADLRERYAANGRKRIYAEEIPGLAFPRRCDIFLPQAYRAVRYRAGMHLGSEAMWKAADVQEDLGPFLERCLESPHTVDRPILILGQPGSGKSMLTHMIGSVLGGRFDTVRIELRAVQADARIYSQISEFVSQETQGRRVTWPDLRDQFTAPPVVILDGLDELLQATGKVFAAYLEDCATFQSESLDGGRPVRTIVTSRIGLIGRAHIPEGTVVIRLEPFDVERRNEWARIWNEHNASFFDDPANGTSPFDPTPLRGDIRDLAAQPLLLLMLAIYDADKNRLANQADLNRTALYHSLVRSFVEREQRRLPDFANLPSDEQDPRVDLEMRRLGIAGLTMFNRRKREITGKDIDEALTIFDLTYPVAKDGQGLGQAERLFDRFFFVTKSETAVAAAGDTTYEFLHATFAEFLAAFTIARRLIDSCRTALAQTAHERQIYVRKPDALPSMWFECLMHAPIFSEPVVLSMLHEWMPQEAGADYDLFLTQLEEFVVGQAKMLLEGSRFPDPFKTLPAQGHAAIYSANLVTIAATLKGELVFDESRFRTYPDEARPWDRMTHLWRGWFSMRVLANLGAALTTRRDGDRVSIRAKKQIEDASSIEAGIERLYTAASGLGDHVLLGLSGYFLADVARSQGPTLDEVDDYLKTEGYSITQFTAFRRIPFAHGPMARQQLMSIVLDEEIPNWETWLRAIWILTAEPARTVDWSRIAMVRELKHLTAPLIARAAGPVDCEAFFDEYSSRPEQLLFAKRSGGRARYEDTYKRVLADEPSSTWSLEEKAMVLQAATLFKDTATMKRLQAAITDATLAMTLHGGTPTSWFSLLGASYFTDQFQTLLAMWETLHANIELNTGGSRVTLSDLSMSTRRSFGAYVGVRTPFRWKSVGAWFDPLVEPNPYLPGYGRALRNGDVKGEAVTAALRQLETCLDLPVDVQIELLDLWRRTISALDVTVTPPVEFPLAALDDVPLASVATARRVAEWMGRTDALKAIDARLAGSPPPAASA
jgi:hypothetical protein